MDVASESPIFPRVRDEHLGHGVLRRSTLRYAHSNDDAKRRAVERISRDGDKIVTVVPRTTKTAAVL